MWVFDENGIRTNKAMRYMHCGLCLSDYEWVVFRSTASAPLTYPFTGRRVKIPAGAMASADSQYKRKGRDDGDDQNDESPKKQSKGEGNTSRNNPPEQQQTEEEDPNESEDWSDMNTERGDQGWRDEIHNFGFPAIFDKAYGRVGIRVRDREYIYINPGPGNPLVGVHPDSEVHKDRVERWSEELAEFIASDSCLEDEGWQGVQPLGYGGFGKVGLWSREVVVEGAKEDKEGGEIRKGKPTRGNRIESPEIGQSITKVEVST